MVAPASRSTSRQAAFLDFLDGNISSLNQLADALSNRPLDQQRFPEGDRNYVGNYHKRILEAAPLWIAEAVKQNKTSAFSQATDVFLKFSSMADKRTELQLWERSLGATLAQFFAFWNNEPKKIQDHIQTLKQKNDFGFINRRSGLSQFTKIAAQNALWNHPDFIETRNHFYTAAFTNPNMKDMFGNQSDWFNETLKYSDLIDYFIKISENPPENIQPTILTHIYKLRAERELKNKNTDAWLNFSIKAIEVSPTDGTWKDSHFNACMNLADRLIKEKKIDQAKQVYAMVKTENLNPAQTKRHTEFLTKLPPAD